VARALAALLLAAATVPCAQARDALRAVDDCVARLDNELDVGYARIAARCPDLTPALQQSPWAPWLPADWKRPDNQLSAAGLSEMRALLARAAGPGTPERAAPRTDRVGAVLATVTAPADSGGSWWLRFKEWLHRIFTPPQPADRGWLRHWLQQIRLSTNAAQLIVWSAFALVVALAAAIILHELRVAGFLSGRAARTRARSQLPHASGARALADIERAAAEAQPGLLLELIALRLAEQDRLPPARALTARELEQHARLPDDSGRRRLGELVGVCERVRFSGEAVTVASLAAALHSGRVLLSALDAPASAAAQAH
jgi:Domain of unknown function (DUF4129)